MGQGRFLGLLSLDGLLGGASIVVDVLLNAKARQLLGESLTVLGVAHGVDDGVEAGSGLGAEAGNLGQKGGDAALATNDGQEDNKGIGRPDAGPEGDVGHSNLGNPDLGSLGVGVGVGPEAVDIHLLGLLTKGVLVGPDGLDDGGVEEEDHGHGDEVAEEEAEEDIALMVPVLVQVVVGAGVEHTLGGVVSPDLHEGREGNADGVTPDGQEDGHGLARSDLDTVESLDNDVVAVIADHHHGEDGHNTADGSNETVEAASKSSPSPVPLHEDIDGHNRSHGGHHDQVGEGQVDHEHVGGCSEGLDLQEDEDDAAISKEGDDPQEEEQDAEEVGDQRVGRGKAGPVGVNDLHNILGDPVGHLHACGIKSKR